MSQSDHEAKLQETLLNDAIEEFRKKMNRSGGKHERFDPAYEKKKADSKWKLLRERLDGQTRRR